jgi:hypothetical protein
MLKIKPEQYVLDPQQEHTVTKTDLIFVKQLDFSIDILNEIQNYNYQTILNKLVGTGYNFYTKFDNGGTKVVGLDDWDTVIKQQPPTYMDKIKQLIVAAWAEIDPDAVLLKDFRINLNIGVPTDRPSDVHLDVTGTWSNEWSALVHLNDSDGPTEFFTSRIVENLIFSVPFKAGQLIIFPSVYAHRGSVPTSNNRITINYIFDVNTELNTRVLKR